MDIKFLFPALMSIAVQSLPSVAHASSSLHFFETGQSLTQDEKSITVINRLTKRPVSNPEGGASFPDYGTEVRYGFAIGDEQEVRLDGEAFRFPDSGFSGQFQLGVAYKRQWVKTPRLAFSTFAHFGVLKYSGIKASSLGTVKLPFTIYLKRSLISFAPKIHYPVGSDRTWMYGFELIGKVKLYSSLGWVYESFWNSGSLYNSAGRLIDQRGWGYLGGISWAFNENLWSHLILVARSPLQGFGYGFYGLSMHYNF